MTPKEAGRKGGLARAAAAKANVTFANDLCRSAIGSVVKNAWAIVIEQAYMKRDAILKEIATLDTFIAVGERLQGKRRRWVQLCLF